MDLKTAIDVIHSIQLPRWVHGVEVEEDTDADNQPIVRVWLKVNEDIEVETVFDEFLATKARILEALSTAGFREWVAVTLSSTVPE